MKENSAFSEDEIFVTLNNSYEKTNVTIAPATEESIAEITKIEAECFSEPWSEKSFRDALKLSSAEIFVALDDKMDVLGYFVLYYSSDQGELQNIAVCPGYRGYGIGSLLMEKLISESLKLGMSQIYLEVRSTNEPAKELYRKYGFIPTGIRKNFYRFPTEDAIVEMKDLLIQI